jgi:hypothetical protein
MSESQETLINDNIVTQDNYKITYITEPKNSDFSKAKRVKCIVYSYTTDGKITYGACIYRKINKNNINNINNNGYYETESKDFSLKNNNDFFKKKNIRSTAISRFKKKPIIFNVEFKELSKEIDTKITQPDGTIITKKESVPIHNNIQVIKAITQKMCDPINGGVKKSSK